MATSPNFNWPEPDNTDLVKNGALAIRTAVDAIDTSLVDLKGGTTGQVLAKTSATDMDFTWTTPSTGISNAFFAGKNKIINGDLGIWQRGTSFTANNAYTADRFIAFHDGTVTATTSQQTFTLGTAPVSGYSGIFFIRKTTTSQSGGTYNTIQQPIESVRTFAGQTMTVSFWAKADASRNITVSVNQDFGSSGSPSGTVSNTSSSIALTTSWARYSYTLTLASIAGKTITTGDKLVVAFNMPLNSASTIDIWGVQAEAGSTATDFQTATGTLQGELAACQRYYYRNPKTAISMGYATNATAIYGNSFHPVEMRTTPTVIQTGGATFSSNTSATIFTVDTNGSGTFYSMLSFLTGASNGLTYLYRVVEWSAEL
jgi:hypothetical protein